jgi:small subunit ribosomal protein S7
MARRRSAEIRTIIPDPVYNDETISKFMNCLMINGKKLCAEKIVYSALEETSKSSDLKPPELLKKVLEMVRPLVEVKSRRVGGSTYQVPVEVRPQRAQALAIRWIIGAARSRPGKSMQEKLAMEFSDILQKRGSALRKKEEVHRMAEANKAFSHFRY